MRKSEILSRLDKVLGSLSFSDAHRILQLIGPTMVLFSNSSADDIEIRASELISGKRKGQKVLRIEWANSTTTIDEGQWNNAYPIHHNQVFAIHATLSMSPEVAHRIKQILRKAAHAEDLEHNAFLLTHLLQMKESRK